MGWRGNSAKEAERAALEGCQLRYGQPCILLAVNDELKAPDPYTAPRQDMPRIRYDGAFRIEMVPLLWERALPLFREYPARKGNKAIAIRPGPPYIYVSSNATSVAAAEKEALDGCNGKISLPIHVSCMR